MRGALLGKRRRISAPTDLAGCQLWLDASRITTLAADDPVDTWGDASGKGRNFTGTTTTRPLYKTAIQASKPVLRFDGTDDVLTSSATLAALATTSAFTWFFAGSFSTSKKFFEDSGSETVIVSRGTAARFDLNTFNGSTYDTATVSGYTSGAFCVLTVQHGGGFLQAWLNGTAGTAVAAPATPDLTGTMAIGGTTGSFCSCDLGEIACYNRALSPVERQAVETYLRGKWGAP